MASEPLQLSELQNQLAAAKAVQPMPGHLEQLAARMTIGNKKVEAAKAAGGNNQKIHDAEEKLAALSKEYAAAIKAEQRWYVLDVAHDVWQDFMKRYGPAMCVGARLAIVVPDVIEVKVRLDGTNDVPF